MRVSWLGWVDRNSAGWFLDSFLPCVPRDVGLPSGRSTLERRRVTPYNPPPIHDLGGEGQEHAILGAHAQGAHDHALRIVIHISQGDLRGHGPNLNQLLVSHAFRAMSRNGMGDFSP